jgi:uncharacterized protein
MDSTLSSITMIAILILFICIAFYFKIVKVNVKYLCYFVAVFLVHYHVIWLTPDFLYTLAGLEFRWNWPAKFFGIIFSLAVIFIYLKRIENVKLETIGLTFKQNPNSVFKSLILLTFIVVILNIGKTFHFPFDQVETLLYQASMPGIDEEIMFRGILLYILSRAIVSSEFTVVGAKLNWACIFVSVLFGLVHGIRYSDGVIGVSLFTTLITGLQGFCFVWSRQLTGSVLLPIIIHNCVNFSLHIFI